MLAAFLVCDGSESIISLWDKACTYQSSISNIEIYLLHQSNGVALAQSYTLANKFIANEMSGLVHLAKYNNAPIVLM